MFGRTWQTDFLVLLKTVYAWCLQNTCYPAELFYISLIFMTQYKTEKSLNPLEGVWVIIGQKAYSLAKTFVGP